MLQRIISRQIRHSRTHLRFRKSPSSFNSAYQCSQSCTYKQFPVKSPRSIDLGRGEPILASSGSAIFVAVAGCVALSGSIIVYQDFAAKLNPKEPEVTALVSSLFSESTMVGAVLPGRPGNLTAEQEVKLQEFWRAALKVFGVSLEDDIDSVNSIEVEKDAEDHESTKGEEKKKKRKGLFRKRKDTKIKSEEPLPADADDKYGQTKEFHQALATNTSEELRTAFWNMVKHDHPDGLLLRFLRARKWDVDKALVMMVSTMQWRLKEMHVDDDIVVNGEGAALKDTSSSNAATKKEGEDFMTQLRMGKSFLHGHDKEGRPLCVVRARLHKPGEQTEQSLERFTVHVIETCRLVLAPPVDTATIVFDMTNFSLSNMDYAPVKFMIKVFEANYPESLGVVLVHKAPWVFQGIWRIIKGWLDPVVAGKVHFTNNVNDLSNFIERSNIIKELEGPEDWEFKYIEPIEGENSKLSDTETRERLQKEREVTIKEYEEATKKWIHKDAGDKSAIEKRNAIAEKLRDGYWTLDPYIRARSVYDRAGVIGPDGQIHFYPQEAVGSIPAVAGTTADDLD